jgi:hypothetical protein
MDPPDIKLQSSVSHQDFAAALRLSVQAFHALALARKTFLAQTAKERLNKHGTPNLLPLVTTVSKYSAPAADSIT